MEEIGGNLLLPLQPILLGSMGCGNVWGVRGTISLFMRWFILSKSPFLKIWPVPRIGFIFLILILILSSCLPQSTLNTSNTSATSTPVLLSTNTPQNPPATFLPNTPTSLPLSPSSPSPLPPITPSPSPSPISPFPLFLPVILPDVVDPISSAIDPTYRFASTQSGLRPVHHGIELLLPFGSPVLAAADGVVLFAGNDSIRGPYGPPRRHDYFGNFVVLEHPMTLLTDRELGETTFYTVYAHLSQLDVQTGDIVLAGDQIGLIGFTGAALGPHLHFEVRLNGFTYADSFNPELFLNQPGRGVLIGQLLNTKGKPILGATMNLTYHNLETGDSKILYITTYEDANLTARPPYNENFGLSLPPGQYDLTFILSGTHMKTFEIRAGEITLLDIHLGDE